ncbi:MAG: hypothetical protein OXG19_05875 [Chloroflexi bacterium]|nr:hypothetical protein [Chloroflexota bacterium]
MGRRRLAWGPLLLVCLLAAACNGGAESEEPAAIPTARNTLGSAEAPLHVVHWGDFQ